jgi:LysR family hca operon transcriptional activator
MKDGLELRHLRYFVAVAGERHFGRAAAALHVTQPLLSRQVRELERLLGLPLLARTRPVIELTPAGEQFFQQAQQTLQQAERAIRAAQRANGNPDQIVIAFEPCSTFHGFARLAERLKRALPEVHLDIRELPVAEHVHRLRSGEIDVAYAHRNEDAAGITFTSLGRESLLLVLPKSHPLARRRTLSVKLLGEVPFVFWHRSLAPACHDYVLRLLSSNGVNAGVQHWASDHRKSLEMVAGGLGWTVAPECARRVHQEGLSFREIEGAATIELGISHLSAKRSPQLNSLLRLWRESALP